MLRPSHVSRLTSHLSRLTFPVSTVALVLVGACGGGPGKPATAPDPRVPKQVLALSQLFMLEMSGIPPEDTVVTFPAGQARVIILRHGPPDNTVFAQLTFPDSVFPVNGVADSVTVVVHPRPGIYSVDLAMTVVPARGATIRFKYPVHFSAPREAIQRYGSRGRFERSLSIGVLADGTNYALLNSLRPASDNLEAAVPGPGTYIVAAPKEAGSR
jgi:hypothetical protein